VLKKIQRGHDYDRAIAARVPMGYWCQVRVRWSERFLL
jgi:hypothetical protein